MQASAISIDAMLSTLNATDVGTLDSISEKLRFVKEQLEALGQPELADRAASAIESLSVGDVTAFKRTRSFLQSKIGHLRR